MDERHWWFATKLQETFHIGAQDSPTMLEDFMAEQTTLDYINDFLAVGGHTKLFFYCPKPSQETLVARKMSVTNTTAKLREVLNEESICLYFLRSDADHVIESNRVEKDVFCGEIKESPLLTLNLLVSDIFAPILRAQKKWDCSDESVAQFLVQFEKLASTLNEYATASVAPQPILKRAEMQVSNDFKQNRAAAINPMVLSEYEALVTDWTHTIEGILCDGLDDRALDGMRGPLTESHVWHRRQKHLIGITEQLKTKECKGVIAILITGKSKILKKWKVIDTSITDAFNETKDKVKYLDSLKRYFEQLYLPNITVSTLSNTVLPGLMATVRQMDAISRYYSRTGYLGVLFTKVTNQLVHALQQYVRASVIQGDEDRLWQVVEHEVKSLDGGHSALAYMKIKNRKKQVGPEVKHGTQDDIFSARLNSCLLLQKQYRDMIRTLRDNFGAASSHSTAALLASTPGQPNPVKRSFLHPGNIGGSQSSTLRLPSNMSSQGNKHRDSDSTSFQGVAGVSLADEETVFTSMDLFCTRLRNMLDIINTLAQLSKLCEAVKDLPRLPREVLGTEEEITGEDEGDEEQGKDLSRTISDTSFEEEEVIIEDPPHISSELDEMLQDMKDSLVRSITAHSFLDILGKDREQFEMGYSEYVHNVRKIEAYICQYVEGIFTLKFSVKRSLQILSRFECVINRPGLRSTFSDKYLAVFSNFEDVLEEVQTLYETQKESPPLSRNAPMVSGAIAWSRGLLRKIEEPMKIFKENKFITSFRDFGRMVKFYNRIATALVKFESLWLTMWKSRIESAKVALKLPLLAHHPETKELIVNADERVVELIQECKGLQRFSIQLPENALDVFRQESRFKNYKQHLEFVLNDYSSICALVPEPLKRLLLPHMESVIQYLQPGLSTLAWNSMNIDAYLHQVHLANGRLRVVVEGVNKVVVDGIQKSIACVEKSTLFDVDLAYQKRWEADGFKDELKKDIKDKQTKLSSMLKSVENSIQEVISLAAFSRSISPNLSPSQTPRVSISPRSIRPGIPGARTVTSVSGVTEESIIGEIYTHYCGLAHKALLHCIQRSLQILYHSVCPAEMIKDMDNGSEINSRPSSAASSISSSSEWAVPNPPSDMVQFEVGIKFNIPDIVISPTLALVQSAVNDVATCLVDVCKDIQWWAVDTRETLYQSISQNATVSSLLKHISDVVTCLQNSVDRQLLRFHRYDFLWEEDMHALYQAFVDTEPSTAEFRSEVDRLQSIEKDIFAIPDLLTIGPVSLNTTPVKDSLHGLAVAWKMKYSTELHEIAKGDLQQLVEYREEMQERLSHKVVSLENLNETLNLLQELNDRDNTIDEVYLPVENSYIMLRDYHLALTRKEVEEVNNLRDRWKNLMDLADQVQSKLMVEKRNIFEQELDKEVKRFVVEVIQFRNSFDSQGPGVPGVLPADAVERLHNFQNAYSQYEAKRKILDAVQLLFGVSPTHYPELDRTGEELVLLGLLYGLFQQYISFDESFREKLWADVDLIDANREVESYWQQCLRLPERIQEWQAYKAMKSYISQYLDVFPILHKLASKEIRNRHWLQVMSVTGSSFQLEANVFKLKYLLDIELINHQDEIKDICSSASRELELEVKMRSTEEEWTEQVLEFEKFKDGATYCLSNQHTEGLLELLEDAQSSLAMMLTSKYIGPLQHEAAAWAMKLKEISEVLEQWLAVQDFWRYLEAVFSNPITAKELPQEFSRFARVDKGYMKMTKRAYDTKNVLQCCVGGDVPKIQVLKHLYEELEICFKSLQAYLGARRKVFPRFYFLSDLVLLAILSQPYTLDSVKPHLKSLFVGLTDITLTPRQDHLGKSAWNMVANNMKKSLKDEEDQSSNLILPPYRKPSQNMQSEHDLSRTGSRNLSTSVSVSSYSDWRITLSDAVAVSSDKGETLPLKKEVFLNCGVELWLSEISRVLQETVHDTVLNCVEDAKTLNYIDEIAQKYPPQVACLGLLYMWTRECEAGIGDIRIDRKALPNAIRRFWSILSRLPNILVKGCWRNIDQNLTVASQAKLEALLSYGMYLRDIVDDLGKRKLRDITDFEWKRNLRFYGNICEEGRDGKPHSLLHLMEMNLEYGNEFYGSRMPIVLTPMTERYFLTLTKATTEFQCGAIVGESGVGKTETAKSLAHTLGQYFVSLSCTPKMDYGQVAKILTGLAQEGCWGILDEFHRAPPAVVSVIFHYVQAVIDALKVGQTSCYVNEGKEIVIRPTFNIMLTATTDGQDFSLATELKAYFRSVVMVMPDMSLIVRAYCAGQGLKSPKVLADRYTMVAKICQAQLSNCSKEIFSLSSLISVVKVLGALRRSQNPNAQNKISMMTSDFQMRPTSNTSILKSSKFTGDREKKSGSPSGLTTAAKLDHSYAMQVLQQCIGPRLSQEDLGIFNGVVRDAFSGLPRVPCAPDQHVMNERTFESLLGKHASENGLIARPQWVDKVIQLYHISENNHGIVVAGGPGSGKTSCITSLVETLARWSLVTHGNTGAQVHAHKLQRINPLAVSDLSLMFGQLGPNGDWLDGIFTSYWRKANKEHNVHRTTTWLCLDAPLHQGWAENLSSVLDDGKYLTLDNCERLHLADDVKIVFETDDLKNVSPAVLSRTALVYMDDDTLGWQTLAEAWLNEKHSAMERKCLQKAFNNTLDTMSHFVIHDSKPLVKICEVGLFSTCLALLEALMRNNTELSSELHIERLYLFSLIWSFGVLLDVQDRKKFGDLLLTLTNGLPDYDQEISVFDYYLDESGEWELWRSRVPDESYFDAADLLGEVFVETDQTVRARLLMELVRTSGRNILLVGPEGAGKSCLVNDFLDKQVIEDKKLMVRRYVYSSNSSASSLQRFIESNIHHRQGYDYGARGGKTLNVFVEDLNLPEADMYGVQEVNELLRQLLDYRALYTLQKPFEWRLLEDLAVIATMNISFKSPATGCHAPISERLKRHFAVFRLPIPVAKTLFSIVTCVLEGNMSHNQGMGLQQELHEQITEATCSLVESVQDTLIASPTPGRLHYHFNLRDVARVFQGLKNCPEEMRADENYVVSLWQHEVQRVMGDRISRSDDITWFERKMKDLTKLYFPEKLANSPSQFFVTFNTDTKEFYAGRAVTSSKATTIKTTHQAIVSLDEVIPCLDTYLSRYNDEFSTSPLNLMLSSHVISHIVRIHRILSIRNSGNVLLVGPIGSQLSELAALALYMLEYSIHTIDCSYRGSFLDGLRSAVRRAGCDGKTTTIVIKDRELLDDSYLDAINSLLISGEYPPLFSEDETNSLLQALMPSIKRKFSSFLTDPMRFFLTRVKRNLHVILCLQPTHKVLSSASSHYPGILSHCHINWVKHWGEEALVGKAKHFLQRHNLFQDDASSVLRPSVVSTLASIHEFVLQDCHHIPWARGMSTNAETKPNIEDLKQTENETNDDYGKNLFMERIALANRQVHLAMPNEVFVGPTTYDRFLHCFMSLLKKKEGEIKNLLNESRLCLNTLCEARKDADKLKDYITKTKSEFEEANVTTAKLLDDLTAKSTVLEKLKAKLGVGSDTLRSFIAMIDSEIEDDGSYFIVDEEKDELDEEFERIQVAKMKNRQTKTIEEITMAERERDRLKKELDEAEELVLIWQERLDRTCCERLKTIQNPPTMVGMVMLMAMALLGKHEFSPHASNSGTSTRHDRKSFDGSVAADDSSSSGGHKQKRNRLEPAQPRHPPHPTYAGIQSDGKIDRQTWKAIQMVMADSQKFADALHGVSWRVGLSDDIVRSVEPFFAKNELGELGQPLQGNSAKVVTPSGKNSPTSERRYSHGITITAARYSSEDAVILVEYVLSLLEYTKRYKPYKKVLDYITELSAEQEEQEGLDDDDRYSDVDLQEEKPAESDPEPELTDEDLPRLEKELRMLQEEFDQAVMVKYDLQDEIYASTERLRVAQELLQRLHDFEEDSRVFVVEYSSSEVLLSNCMSAAAFLTYCGPMAIDQRKKMVAHFTNASLKHGLPKESKQVFYDFPLCEYLNGKLALKVLQQSKTLTDSLSLDNSCLVNQVETANTWPLICDPQYVAQSLVTALNQVTIVKFKELRGHLETSLMEGTQLFVTDVDLTALVEDDRFYYVLRSVPTFLKATNPFKLLVGEHEIECQPSFRLFMSTTVSAYRVPAQLGAFMNVIETCLSRDGLEEVFLDRFMELEKPRLHDSRLQSVSEIVRLLKMKEDSEKKFLEVLLKNRQFLHDLSTMKKISSIRRNFEETVESITRADQSETSLLLSREAFRPIARRAAVLFDVIRHMGEVNEKYTISLAQFLKVYDTAIRHSERTAVKAVAERVGQSAFFFAAQGFIERDRTLFALLSAIEVEDSFGRVSPGDREFLIYPAYGAAVKTALSHGSMTASQLRIVGIKKPFDWMTDDQFNGLQLLAQSFDWFQDAFEKMTKDGRETQWRQLVEHDIPELVALPDNLDEKFTPIQRFMIIRAIRPDRLIQASRSFIIQGLGRRYTSDLAFDLGFAYRHSGFKTPVLLLYDEESSVLETFVRDLAAKKQIDLSVVHLSTGCSNEERYARRTLHRAMTEGTWLLLLDGHKSPRLLDILDSLISDSKQIDSNFRLWVSAKISLPLPCSLLQLTVKVVTDSPKNIRDNMVRSMSLVNSETLSSSSRAEWPAVLHNICVLHNLVRLRSQYQLVGWNTPAVINPGALELFDAIRIAAREFGEHNSQEQSSTPVPAAASRAIQWNALRYMLSEVVYGKGIRDEFDQHSLSAMVDYWISPAAVKKEFEASRVKYRLPSVFFSGNARLPSLVQSLESLPANVLDVPEACGLHSSPETVVACDQYIFTHLNKIYDRMPVTKTLTHACIESDFYTPTKGVVVVSGQTHLPGASHLAVEKSGVFASASLWALRHRKDIDLLEICTAALSKVPRPWSKEAINEKLKKGGVTSFSLFVLAEVEQMQKLILTIRDDLQTIKTSVSDGVHGDIVPPDVLEVAAALYHLRIPSRWVQLAGNSSPPVSWSLTAWLTDLQSRHSHIERVVTQGRDRVPAYWLGAFFNPKRLLAIVKQEAIRNFESSGRSSVMELFVLQSDITGRDKDHLREPPLEGIFLYGLYMWGCAWEKTTGDLMDAPPRHGPTPLPVVHVTVVPQSEKQSLHDPQKAAVSYSCPCYPSRICPREPVLTLDIDNKDVSASRWPLRGLCATLRPF